MSKATLLRALTVLALTGGLLPGGSVVLAKGPVDKIAIAGPGLPRPIEVTRGDALGEFNPWAGLFLGERVDPAPGIKNPAQVTMYLAGETGELEPLYSFEYYRGVSGGYVYLPGPGDAAYELNKTTIMTPNDGKWFRATVRWDAFVAGALAVQPPATGDGGLR